MKVFISYAKEKSKLTAEALASWLPQVIQAIEPWVSSSDVEKGKRWSQEISDSLEKTRVGIICLNKENLNEPWILFEAGAIAKTKDAYVFTFLLDVAPTDVQQPLGQFQHTKCEKEDVKKLVITINNSLEKSGEKALQTDVLNKVFEKFWPELDENLKKISNTSPSSNPVIRQERELLEEILELLRSQQLPYYETSVGQIYQLVPSMRGYGVGAISPGLMSGIPSPSPSIEISSPSASIEHKGNEKPSPKK